MNTLSEEQLQLRGRIESLIRFAAPVLDLVLACGDRVSRVVQSDDPEYYPVRPIEEDYGG